MQAMVVIFGRRSRADYPRESQPSGARRPKDMGFFSLVNELELS